MNHSLQGVGIVLNVKHFTHLFDKCRLCTYGKYYEWPLAQSKVLGIYTEVTPNSVLDQGCRCRYPPSFFPVFFFLSVLSFGRPP